MAQQVIKDFHYAPAPPRNVSLIGNTPNLGTTTLDATSEKSAMVFWVETDATLTGFYLHVGGVVGASGTATLDCRGETVASGVPTGTLLAANTNGSVTVNFNSDNSWLEATFTSSVAVTAGQQIALVVNLTALATVTSVEINTFADSDPANAIGFNDLSVGSYSQNTGGQCPCFVPKFDGSFWPIDGHWPCGVITTHTFNNTAGTRRVGNKGSLPYSGQIQGLWVLIDLDAGVDYILYASDGSTPLASLSDDATLDRSTSAVMHYRPFTVPYSYTANTVFYIAAVPTSASNISLYSFTAPSSAALDGYAGGSAMYLSTHNGTSWSDTTSSRAFIGLKINKLDDGVGGGSALIVPPKRNIRVVSQRTKNKTVLLPYPVDQPLVVNAKPKRSVIQTRKTNTAIIPASNEQVVMVTNTRKVR